MKLEEKQISINTNDITDNNSKNNNLKSQYSQQSFFTNRSMTSKKKQKYLNILNNPILTKFSFQKTKKGYRLKSSTIKNKHFPLLTFTSKSLNDILFSNNSNNIDLNSLKKILISNKSKMNKKKAELQELKIQYNKLLNQNKNIKNLIFEVLNLENEQNNDSCMENDIYNVNQSLTWCVSEEQLISKINSCIIDEEQEKKLKDSYQLINLRMEINSKKKLLLDKNNEYDELKIHSKFKNKSEMANKLKDLTSYEYKIKEEVKKLEEILQKKLKEILPKIEKELEIEEKNFDEINKKVNEFKKSFNDKVNRLNKLKKEILKIVNKSKFKKVNNTLIDGIDYKGKKTIGSKLKEKIDQMKIDLSNINKYKNEMRENIIKLMAERKSKLDKQKKKNKELELKIDEINEKNKNLYLKFLGYNEEKSKLENKGKEQNKDIKKLEELEQKLNKVKNIKQQLIKECEEKEKILKENEKELNEQNKEILEKINNLKTNNNNMNKQVKELNDKINEIEIDIEQYQEQINNKKKEIENLNDKDYQSNEEKDEENKQNSNQNIEEEFQRNKNYLINENEKYRKENEKLKNEINLIEDQIQKYIGSKDI